MRVSNSNQMINHNNTFFNFYVKSLVKQQHILETKYDNFMSHFFGKNFVKVTFLLNKLLLVDFTEKLQIGNLVINVIDLSQHTNQSLNQLHQIDWYIKSSGIGLFQHQFLARNGSKSAVTIFAVFRTQFSRNIFRKIVFCISRNFAKLATLICT